MRLDIEGEHMMLAPHLMGWIAERLEDLNTSYDDICKARVTFVQHGRQMPSALISSSSGRAST